MPAGALLVILVPVKNRSEFERGMPELLSLEFADKAGKVGVFTIRSRFLSEKNEGYYVG